MPKIKLPEEKSLQETGRYIVVEALYSQMRTEPSFDAKSIGVLRKGEIAEVKESKFSSSETEKAVLWYRVQVHGLSGWLPRNEILIFATQQQAEAASRRMK